MLTLIKFGFKATRENKIEMQPKKRDEGIGVGSTLNCLNETEHILLCLKNNVKDYHNINTMGDKMDFIESL